MKNCFSTRERPARTPPSTFLFLPIHLSNSPAPWRSPSPEFPESRRSPKPPTEIGRLVTTIVRCFAGAPSRRKASGAPLWGLYSRGVTSLSTARRNEIPGKFRTVESVHCARPPTVRTNPECRTGATFLPRCSHRGKASVHSANHEFRASTLTRWRRRAIVVAGRCDREARGNWGS